MERFLVSPVEEVDRGVEIGDEVLVIDRNHPLQTPISLSSHWQVGLRLMAGQWLSEWLCREEGLQWPEEGGVEGTVEKDNFSSDNINPVESISVFNDRISNPSNYKNVSAPSNTNSSKVNFKLVLAEPLPDSPWSHVNTFLEAHGGPGLQVSTEIIRSI